MIGKVRTLLYASLILLIAFLVKLYVFEVYMVDQVSMRNTLMNGDKVLVSKIFSVKRGDIWIVVKNNNTYIKRCIGMPGEKIMISGSEVFLDHRQYQAPGTVIIRDSADSSLSGSGRSLFDVDIYKCYGKYWTEAQFGEFLIPYKGLTIKLDPGNMALYKNIIAGESTLSLKETSYTFKNDYFFVLGDNRPVSRDSRTFGLIRRDSIIGAAKWVLYSKYHFWDRGFFKKII